jgi:hypothetical protein
MSEIPQEPSAEDLMSRDLAQTMAAFNERHPPTLPGLPKTLEKELDPERRAMLLDAARTAAAELLAPVVAEKVRLRADLDHIYDAYAAKDALADEYKAELAALRQRLDKALANLDASGFTVQDLAQRLADSERIKQHFLAKAGESLRKWHETEDENDRLRRRLGGVEQANQRLQEQAAEVRRSRSIDPTWRASND